MGKKSREKQQKKQGVLLEGQQKNKLVQAATEQPVLFKRLTVLVFIGLCLLLFYPPYMRAMFFTREQLPTHLLTLILFLLWWAVKYQRRDFAFLREPLDYLIFGFVLSYVLSFTVAINHRGAIQEFLKVSNYFLVYWLVIQLGQTRKEAPRIFLNVLMLSALGVAVLGLGAAAGTWEVTGGYVSGRISSTIQYPNSLAAYLTGAFLVCLGLLQTAPWRFRQFYAVAAFLLLITTILTYSRGGWLVMPVFFLLYVIFMPRTKRLDAALLIALFSAVSIGLTPFAGQGGRLWLLVFLGCAAVLAGQFLLVDLRRRVSPRFLLATVGLLALLLFGAAGTYVYRIVAAPLHLAQTSVEQLIAVEPGVQYNLMMDVWSAEEGTVPFAWQLMVLEQRQDTSTAVLLQEAGGRSEGWEAKEFIFTTSPEARRILLQLQSVHPGTSLEARDVTLVGDGRTRQLGFAWNRLLPGLLYSRLFGLDRERNVQERFVFFKDAWEIIKDYPVRGLGGHGWSSIYFKYQSAPYSTTEVHNHFLQVWIETGIIGFLFFLGIWLGLIFTSYRLYKQALAAEQKVLIVAIACGVLAVVTHSLYDFTLSLGAIGIFLFGLMGVTRSFVPRVLPVTGQSQAFKPVLAVGLTLGMLVFILRLMIGHAAFDEGNRLMQRGQHNQAVSAFERAARHDPFDPRIRFALAEVYERQGVQTQNNSYFVKAKEQYRAAFERNSYHPFYAHLLGSFLIRAGLFEEGFTYLQRAISLQPGSISHYQHYASAYLRAAHFSFTNNDRVAGQRYLEGVFAAEKQVQEVFGDPTAVALTMGQAYFMLGNYEQARPYLEKALYSGADKAHASMMLALIYEKMGDSAKRQEFYDRAIGLDPASQGTYQAFKAF